MNKGWKRNKVHGVHFIHSQKAATTAHESVLTFLIQQPSPRYYCVVVGLWLMCICSIKKVYKISKNRNPSGLRKLTLSRGTSAGKSLGFFLSCTFFLQAKLNWNYLLCKMFYVCHISLSCTLHTPHFLVFHKIAILFTTLFFSVTFCLY